MNRRTIHGRRANRGQGLTEFALVFPVLIIVLVAVFDVGRLVFAYNTITNAAREAARLGIVDQTSASITNEAINQGISLGLSPTDVDVKFCDGNGTGCSTTKPTNLDKVVRVQVSYSWTAITPIIGNLIGPKKVTATSEMPIERLFP